MGIGDVEGRVDGDEGGHGKSSGKLKGEGREERDKETQRWESTALYTIQGTKTRDHQTLNPELPSEHLEDQSH